MSEPWERGFVRRNLPLIAKGLIWSWLRVKPLEGKPDLRCSDYRASQAFSEQGSAHDKFSSSP